MGINFEDAYNELRVQLQKISKSAAASLRRETQLQNRVRALELKLDEAGIAYEKPEAVGGGDCTCGNVPMGCTCGDEKPKCDKGDDCCGGESCDGS